MKNGNGQKTVLWHKMLVLWPWRRVRKLVASIEATREFLDENKWALGALESKVSWYVYDGIRQSRWKQVFPWITSQVIIDEQSGFTRGIISVSNSAVRSLPCFPWQKGAYWKGIR